MQKELGATMKRQTSLVALTAAALLACQAVSAEAKPTRAPSHKSTTTSGVKVPTGNIDPGYGVKPGQLKTGSGFNINNVNGAPALPTQTGIGNRPTGHGPVVLPTNPVTWGGNPPRAPTTGCGDKCGNHDGDCCHHDCHHRHDRMWWSRMCFENMSGGYYGDCDDCYGDCDSDFCP